MPISFGERVEKITPVDRGFVVKTAHAEYHCRSILLAIGRRGSPRKLGVPGEELPKVVYRLIDPEQYQGKHVLVVGGGNAAIEAAVAVAAEPGAQVTLSYRGSAFGRVTERNRERLDEAQRGGQLALALGSTVKQIDERPSFSIGKAVHFHRQRHGHRLRRRRAAHADAQGNRHSRGDQVRDGVGKDVNSLRAAVYQCYAAREGPALGEEESAFGSVHDAKSVTPPASL